MKTKNTKKVLTLILISAFFSYSLTKIKIGNSNSSQYSIYSIIFEYYGIDPLKLEKIITIPLEEQLSQLDAVHEIKSTIQFNKTITTIQFYKTADINSIYQNISQITDSIYSSLPSNVQKPQIISSDIEQKPVICISFDADKNYIERNIKPAFEAINDVTEVIISGGTKDIISISFLPEKLHSLNLSPYDISDTVNNENSENLFISSESKNYISNIYFNNCLNSINQLNKTILTEKSIPLSNIAKINLTQDLPDELVLLNNKDSLFLCIKTTSDANLISISTKCSKLLHSNLCSTLNPTVIYDLGHLQKTELLSTAKTILLTIFISCIFIFLFYHDLNILLLSCFEILITIFWTISSFPLYNQFIIPLLKLINSHKHYDKYIINSDSLSGLSLSIGLITDILLVTYELFNKSKTITIFNKDFKALTKSAVTSTATTILAVIPLFAANSYISGISSSAFTIILMLFYSTIISLLFCPSFLKRSSILFHSGYSFLSGKQNITFIKSKLKLPVKYLYSKPKTSKLIFIFLSILCTILFLISGKNIEPQKQTNIIYAQLNFNPEKSKESIQKETEQFINSLTEIKEINFIKSEYTRGHAELEIIYQTISEHALTSKIKQFKNLIPDAFLYISETSENNKQKPLTFQFIVTGDNEPICRKIATQAAKQISENNLSLQTVLNFTDEEIMYSFIPDQTKLSKLKLTVSDISQLLRSNIFHPVISKYIMNNKETDIKLKNLNTFTTQNIEQLNPIDSTTLNSLGKIQQSTIPSKIHRYNCRPCAYFTIELNRNKLNSTIPKIKTLLKSIKIEDNYFIKFPDLILESQTSYSKLSKAIIICFICIFLFLTSLNENPQLSFSIILTIPSSLFLPIFIRIITNTSLNFGDFIGIILLSGIVINNSIYISESKESLILDKIKSKYESILITSFTTILSSLPMMIFSSSPFIKSLSFFMFFGTIGSIISSLLLFPNYINGISKKHESFT